MEQAADSPWSPGSCRGAGTRLPSPPRGRGQTSCLTETCCQRPHGLGEPQLTDPATLSTSQHSLGAGTILGAGKDRSCPSRVGTIYGKCDLYLILQTSRLQSSVTLRACFISLGLDFPHLPNGLIIVLSCSPLRSPLPASAPTPQHGDAMVSAVPPVLSRALGFW